MEDEILIDNETELYNILHRDQSVPFVETEDESFLTPKYEFV